ncbi:MAG: hypothetical protein ACKVWV_14915 [Planctomycetota bacterium]
MKSVMPYRILTVCVLLSARPALAQCPAWGGAIHGSGLAGTAVRAMTVMPSCAGGQPELYVAVSTALGSTTARVQRWNGSAWSAVGSGTAEVYSLAVYDHGAGAELYAGRNDGPHRWNGSAWVPLGPWFAGDGVHAMAVFDPGTGPELYIAGAFSVGSNVRRWDGTTLAIADGPSTVGGAFVKALIVYDDGAGADLYCGGTFPESFPINVARIGGPGTPVGALGSSVVSLGVFDDGSGSALFAGMAASPFLAKRTDPGWTTVTGAPNGPVHALLAYDDGTGDALYVGGSFTTAGGVSCANIARWDGATWSALGSGADEEVFACAHFDDGSGAGDALHVGGRFTTIDGMPVSHVARRTGCFAQPGDLFCSGDGSLLTPCPCAPPDVVPAPPAAPGHGCANSFDLAGGKLIGAGNALADTVTLTATHVSPSGYAQFFVGTAADSFGVAVGDGVRCAGGALTRFGGQFATCGTVRYPNPAAGWTLPLSVVSGATPGSGASRHYQVSYRNAAAGFCSAGTTNLTSGYRIAW